jgi:hypothetical protein
LYGLYGLLLRFLPRPLADVLMVLWYFGLFLLILYTAVVEQADFPYARF